MKSISTKILVTIAILVVSFSSMAQSAENILKNAADKLTGSKSISAQFTLSADNSTTSGSIVMSGKRFKMTSSQLSTWYDGKTQWSYSPEIEEINISEPTPEELQQINPFAIISEFKKTYNSQLLSSTSGNYRIQLTAKSTDASIRKVVITLNTKTYYPSQIVVTLDNNSTATINVTNVKTGGSLPKSTFVFNAADYPDAEIIDLR